jgi:DNA-binding NarL/FixJ family response regulator
MKTKIRVLVIDDEAMFRVGLRVGLRKFGDICLDWEAADGSSGLAIVAEHKPDVAIVDVWLPDRDGIEVAEQIRKVSPDTGIILASGAFDDSALARAIRLGVDGITTKTDSAAQFASLIRRVNDGLFSCSASVLKRGLPNQDAASIGH